MILLVILDVILDVIVSVKPAGVESCTTSAQARFCRTYLAVQSIADRVDPNAVRTRTEVRALT